MENISSQLEKKYKKVSFTRVGNRKWVWKTNDQGKRKCRNKRISGPPDEYIEGANAGCIYRLISLLLPSLAS